MRRFSVHIAAGAQDQITEQVRYIAQDSIDRALAWRDRVSGAIQNLAEFHGYAIDEDASGRLGFQLHRLVFEGTYLVHFTVDDAAGVVRVVNFRHGARLPTHGEP